MKQNYICQLLSVFVKPSNLFLLLFVFIVSGAKGQITQTFTYTGAMQAFTVPSCVSNVTIETFGAQGGIGTPTPQNYGGYAKGVFGVTAGDVMNIYVGSQPSTTAGGYNGGGAGDGLGFGGGGGTDVRLNGLALTDRIIVSGGGGGAGVWSSNGEAIFGGVGGGLTGGNGYRTSTANPGGSGGGQTLLTNGFCGSAGNAASSGALGQGGNIAVGACGCNSGYGGGGGYYGGGAGGNCRGGGGGSGFISAVATGTTFTSGLNIGHGKVVLSYFTNGAGVTVASPSLSMCNGNTVTLTASSAVSYTWNPGNVVSSSIQVSPSANTDYTVQGTNSIGCISSAIISVTVSGGQPTLSVVSSTNQTCLGKTATLTASGALTYTWSNGVSNGVSFYPSTTTTYTVTGQNGCGTVTAVSTISVNPLPVSVASTGTAVCTNKTATLTVTAPATSCTWQPVNVSGTGTTIIVNPQNSTVYTVTASDGTCSGVTTVSIQANPVPTILAIASSSIVCPGGTVGLSATGGINYTWTPVNLNGAAITVSPQSSAVYTVTGDNSFGCLNIAAQVVVVGTQPTLVLGSSSSSICSGGSATLTVSGADTYSWTGGPTTTVYVVNPTTNTTYTVTGTNSSSGCSDTKNIDISVFTPTISVSGSSAVCEGNQVNLTASGGNSYTWSPGSLQFPSISVVPVANTTFTVDALATQGALNCAGSTTFQVIVNPNPTVTTTSVKPAICARETNTYTASGAVTYTWTSNIGTVVGPTISVTSSITTIIAYTLTGTDAQGCMDENNFAVTIYACTGTTQLEKVNGALSVYPNPNKGEFYLLSDSDLDFHLINELGQVVRTLRLNEENRFQARLSDLPNGIYFVVGNDGLRTKILVAK